MNLYAWTNSEYNATFYTDVEDPTTEAPLKIYDQNGNDVTSEYICGDVYFTSVSATTITYSSYGPINKIPVNASIQDSGKGGK